MCAPNTRTSRNRFWPTSTGAVGRYSTACCKRWCVRMWRGSRAEGLGVGGERKGSGYDDIVRDLTGEARLARFRSEVRNSAANYALALAGASLRRRELAARTRGSGKCTSLEWVRGRTAGDGMFSPLAFYEQLVVGGHPLHPGT